MRPRPRVQKIDPGLWFFDARCDDSLGAGCRDSQPEALDALLDHLRFCDGMTCRNCGRHQPCRHCPVEDQ